MRNHLDTELSPPPQAHPINHCPGQTRVSTVPFCPLTWCSVHSPVLLIYETLLLCQTHLDLVKTGADAL